MRVLFLLGIYPTGWTIGGLTMTMLCFVSVFKAKVKFYLCWMKHHAIKTFCGSGGLAPRILNLGARWCWVVSFTPRQLYLQGRSSRYTLHRRLGWPQPEPGWTRWRWRKTLTLPGIEAETEKLPKCHSRVIENLVVSQLVKKFSVFYGTRRFIIVFTIVRYGP
jgi:hypothetical protein